MGMKKEILSRMLLSVINRTRRDPHWAKKMVGLALICGLFTVVSIGFLLYFAGGMAKDFVAGRPDMDLLAMERLLAEKSLILSEEQKQLLAPIKDGTAVSSLAPAEVQSLKAQFLDTITPSQLGKLEAWKDAATSKKAGGLFALPPAVAAIIEEFSGLSMEMVQARIDALLAGWMPTKSENSAEQL